MPSTAGKTGILDTGSLQLGGLEKSVAGSSNVTLTAAEAENFVQEYIGALTGNISVIVPTAIAVADGLTFLVYNNTTGNFTLTFIGAAGTGIVIPQGSSALVRFDLNAAGTDGAYRLCTPPVEQDGDLSANAVNLAAIEDSIIQGQKVAVVAPANAICGIPVTHIVDVPAGATGNVDLVLTYKFQVLEIVGHKRSAAGGGAGTVQFANSANPISNAMSIDVVDQTVIRAGTIDDAFSEIAAGGTLRAIRTRTASTDETSRWFVTGVRIA